MNNSKLVIDSVPLHLEEKQRDNSVFQKKESDLIKIIEALQEIQKSKHWGSLKQLVFDGLVQTLERELRDEAKKDEPDTLKLNRLAGQIKWAEKYADLSKLENVFRVELTNVRTLLYGKSERTG